jgi:hypothetical protein
MSIAAVHNPSQCNRHINNLIRSAAQSLQRATYLYCEDREAQSIPAEHPLCRALAALEELDRETAHAANELPWPPLFAPFQHNVAGETA